MRDKEIVGLYQAYLDVYSNSNEEVEQLDEDVQGAVKGALDAGARVTDNFMKTPVGKVIRPFVSSVDSGRKTPTATSGGYRKEEVEELDEVSDKLVGRAVNARIAATGAANKREMEDRTPENMRDSVRAGEKEASMKSAAANRKKRRMNKEEVENWVNSLIDEGYDLSEYTWDDMYEMYVNLNEARTDPRGRPASGPMSVYGGRGQDAGPGGSGNEKVDRMDAAQRRVKATQPKKKGMSADSLFTKYSARQKGMEHGGEEGPGPNAPKRSGRSGRGANTDRGSGNAAKRRMSEDFDLFDAILEHLVAEGYADTNESALAIMANMSEEWRQSIVEGEEKKEESQKPFTGEGPKKPKGWRPTGPKLKSGQRPGYAR